MPTRTFCSGLFYAALALFFSACTSLPARDTLPPGVHVASRISTAAGSPVAWHPGGEQVALVRDRLFLWTPATGETKALADCVPTALAWSPDGKRLAAVVPAGTDSRLLVTADSTLQETLVPGRVSSLAWGGTEEVLGIAATMKTYRFGANFALQFYRWPLAGDPVAEPLWDTMIMPRTVDQWGERLPETAVFSLAPLADAILFARLRDPPVFLPYLQIILRHLPTGSERLVAEVPLGAGTPLFGSDGETTLFGDGRETRLHNPWTAEDLATFPAAGASFTLSPGGQYLLVDGQLYNAGKQIAAFPTAEGWFAPGGNQLLLRQGTKLLLLTGLPEAIAPPLGAEERDRLLLLRRWRASGLITHSEFLQQLHKDPSR